MPGFLDDYEPVEDRIRKFWADHPTGRIISDLVKADDDTVIVRTEAYRDEVCPVSATGLARESVAQLPANMKASALEVCETSAIGRCLANLGYAPKGARPSREEMSTTSPASAPIPSQGAADAGATSGAGSSGGQPPPAPDLSSGGGGSAAPADTGEGSAGAGAAPSDAPTWQDLVQRAGSASKARERLNLVSGTRYTPRTVQGATALEVSMAVASFEDAEFADD